MAELHASGEIDASDRGEPRGPAPLLFVGGTGRSGTHIVARMVAARNRHYSLVPVEARFHVDEDGFPGLLAGTVSLERFVERLRGFWWRGFQTDRMRGLHRVVPGERFEPAVSRFEQGFEADPVAACRRLFFDLLQDVKPNAPPGAGIVEQSCDSVAQARTLLRLFPEARFIHVVRDGRDASASRVSQRGVLVYPRTRRQGLGWWEQRIRRIDAGARAIPQENLLEIELGELLTGGVSTKRRVRELADFVGLRSKRGMMRFMRARLNPRAANEGRWRQGLSERRRERLGRQYGEILGSLEADGVSCAPLLRAAFERKAFRPASARVAAAERG
jgi:hypothetical protein